MNVYAKKRIARKLPKQLQMDTMYAARRHMTKRGHVSWSIPERHKILQNKSKDELIGMGQIWFETVKQF